MIVKDIVSCIEGEPLLICDPDLLEKEYTSAFATDLMSDALAMIHNSTETMVLVTGLANVQSLRTAEMLDIKLLILVRGKTLPDDILEVAREKDLNIITTGLTMYSACGRLYKEGLCGIYG